MNLFVGLGNLTRDIELRYTPSGKAVANASLAISKNTKRGEEWVQETLFLDLELWDSGATRLAESAAKGTKLLVEGNLKQETWEKDGQRRSKIVCRVNRFTVLDNRRDKVENTEQVEEAVEGSVNDIPF